MGWIVAATCMFLSRAVWVRRWTLRLASDRLKLAERTLTTCLLCQLSALFLMSPLSGATVGTFLHTLTGQWNLDAWAGHCCFMGAAGMLMVNVASRLNISDNQLRGGFHHFFVAPMTVIVPVLLALLTMSSGAKQKRPDMFLCCTDHWLDAYWTLLCAFLMFLLATSVRVLLALRQDPRNERTATAYIVALSSGGAACLLRIITTWDNSTFNYDIWLWAGCCFASSIFAYASARSWRKRIHWLGGDYATSKL